jgi:surface protein
MFSECESLINLDISHFKLEKVLYMDYMFSGCNKKLKDIIRNQINLKEKAFYKEFYFYRDISK